MVFLYFLYNCIIVYPLKRNERTYFIKSFNNNIKYYLQNTDTNIKEIHTNILSPEE